MRRRLVHTMASGRIETDEQAQGALRLVVVLNDSGRVSEALRVGMAFLALSDRNANELPSVAALGSFCGHIHSLRGEIGPALRLLERWLPWQKGRQRSVTQAAMVRVHLLSGMSTFDEALTAPGLDQPRYAHILALACMAENTKVIRACMKFMDSPSGREVKERTVAPHIAPFIARGVERHDLSALRDLEARRMELSGRIGQTMEWDIFEVQLLRLLGEPVRAAKLCAAVDGEIRNLLEPESLDIAMRGQHWRNQLFLGSKRAEIEC